MKIIKNKSYLLIAFFLLHNQTQADLIAIDESDLNQVSGQAGITLNAKIVLGDETSFVYTNTSGATIAEAESANSDADSGNDIDVSYLIVDEISGSIEMKGLSIDLISNLNNSGKAALQWTMPSEIKVENLKTTGIYASSTEAVVGASTFLLAAKVNGTLTLPANTQISAFVTD